MLSGDDFHMSRLATLLLALQLTLPHLDAPNCVGAVPRQGGRRLVQQPSYASEATVAVSTGAELVAALANGAVSTATIDVHIRVDDDDFTGYTLPIIINNNKTVEGSREVKPILDLNFLRSKVCPRRALSANNPGMTLYVLLLEEEGHDRTATNSNSVVLGTFTPHVNRPARQLHAPLPSPSSNPQLPSLNS